MNLKHFFDKSTASQARSQGHPTIEILVAPLSQIGKPLGKLSALPGRLTPEALKNWDRLRSEGKSPSKSGPKSTQAHVLHFTDGGSLHLLFLAPKASTFDLHTELRKALGTLMAESVPAGRELVLNLKTLEAAMARKTAVSLAALARMAGWKPTSFGKKAEEHLEAKKKQSRPAMLRWISALTARQIEVLVQQGTALGEANNLVRTLADLPSNELHPGSYRERAQEFARQHKLSYEFWSIADLAKKKAGAFLAVNRADPASQAGIAILKYVPKKAGKNTPVLALVGKGLCFDTGGYNVKTGNYMYGMHGDMTGSALAMALCGYFASIEAPFEVHAYLALAENLISPTAYRPNDVVVACDGTSIEVIDTDAEGRMVLSDTLALVRKTKPTLCIDYATLTGAAIRSLDTRRCAVFSNDPRLARKAVEAGDESGERTWSFPIGGDYREVLKSKVADIVQCAPVNNADHIYAATFLSHFIGDETPWVHVDLVAAENKGGLGLASSDTTGFGVFWTDAFVGMAL